MTNELKDSPGWTPERRRLQAERIRRQRPWLRSTGPRTAAGKAVSSRNATKHGLRSRACRAFCLLLRMQRDFVRHVNEFRVNKSGMTLPPRFQPFPAKGALAPFLLSIYSSSVIQKGRDSPC